MRRMRSDAVHRRVPHARLAAAGRPANTWKLNKSTGAPCISLYKSVLLGKLHVCRAGDLTAMRTPVENRPPKRGENKALLWVCPERQGCSSPRTRQAAPADFWCPLASSAREDGR